MWLTVTLHLIGMTAAAGAAWVACATFAAGSARADTPRVPQTAVAASAPVNNDDPTWVIDPAYPGDHLPPVGRSLFDFLVTTQRGNRRETQVPFPFSALIERIEQYLARDPLSALPPAKRVLIPMGRSLQRSAAAPEYFRFPRVVVAVDREPVADDRRSMLLLKDRLYLGYQEKSDLIEVISYNEAAGRFEFQLVKDYRGGATPRVVYANRAVCISCHQNGAPLFSRQVWDETNANPRIAALLAAQRRGRRPQQKTRKGRAPPPLPIRCAGARRSAYSGSASRATWTISSPDWENSSRPPMSIGSIGSCVPFARGVNSRRSAPNARYGRRRPPAQPRASRFAVQPGNPIPESVCGG